MNSTERDRLAEIIIEYMPGADGPADSRTIADAIIADGWSHPDPTYAEIEAMDALLRELLGDYEPPWSMRVIRNELLERFTLRTPEGSPS